MIHRRGFSTLVLFIKCLLLKTRTDLVEAGYIRITAGWVCKGPPWHYLMKTNFGEAEKPINLK